MPAPPRTETSSLDASEDVVVCTGFHSDADDRSAAALLILLSAVRTLSRSVLCCVTWTWRFWTAVTLVCSSCISCWMIESVSSPDAMPVRFTGIVTSLQLRAGQHVQRLGGRDCLKDVALEVPDLDDHAVAGLVLGEVQLAVGVVELLHDLGGLVDHLAGFRCRRRGNVVDDRPGLLDTGRLLLRGRSSCDLAGRVEGGGEVLIR